MQNYGFLKVLALSGSMFWYPTQDYTFFPHFEFENSNFLFKV